ncbi:MAG: NAD(P)/FAD-dependent oxidoreductase, partial [Planktomarina sp.]
MFDTIIIGGGAAGLMCAAQNPGRTLVIDHAKAMGEKIRISGGGRCNFTNMYAAPENYICQNPHFMKSALARYTQWDFIDWVARSGIAYHEKTLGQLFCDNSAKDIIAMLVGAVQGAGGRMAVKTTVLDVSKTAKGFAITTEHAGRQEIFACKKLVIATGGKPIPKMGATDFGLKLALQFGLNITPTRAGLVPYAFQNDALDMCKSLAGVSAPAVLRSGKSFEESILFTHRGLSGPAALQTSSYWVEGETIELSLMQPDSLQHLLDTARKQSGKKSIETILATALPSRLVPHLCVGLDLPARVGDLTATQQNALEARITAWTMRPSGTEGYRTAEVMVGGVDTDGLSSKTMEAKSVPGLYFIGECVDVTGWLGGYNF